VTDSCYQRRVSAGIPPESFESAAGYCRSRLNGHACILFTGKRCRHHGIKLETCRAGPFTFDVNNGTIDLFLKTEKTCPPVRLLNGNPEAYRQQYMTAVQNIRNFVARMPKDEPAAVCRIDEPATEYIATIMGTGDDP